MKNKPKGILETLESQIQSMSEKQDMILANQLALNAQINALMDVQVILLKYASQLPTQTIVKEMFQFAKARMQAIHMDVSDRKLMPDSQTFEEWLSVRGIIWNPFDHKQTFPYPTPHPIYEMPKPNQQD